MRPDERDAAYLWDMLNAAREAHMAVEKLTPGAFLEDWLRRRALERTLEVLGEAARKVSEDFRATHPDIDWRGLIGQRNVLAHEYGRINHRLLFETANRRLPPLIRRLQDLLDRL
jgi:uncharacterized protein with HEPN domain